MESQIGIVLAAKTLYDRQERLEVRLDKAVKRKHMEAVGAISRLLVRLTRQINRFHKAIKNCNDN